MGCRGRLVLGGAAGLVSLLGACGGSVQTAPGDAGLDSGVPDTGVPSDAGPDRTANDATLDAPPDVALDTGSPPSTCDAGPVAPCMAAPGAYPAPNCDNSAMMCSTGPSPCPITDPRCGSTSTCEPFTNNTGNVLGFRMRRINIDAPPTLAQAFIQTNVITPSVDLDAIECGETGMGTFNWLLSVDVMNNLLKTGGGPPTTDPFGLGFCFADHMADTGQLVAPQTTPVEFAPCGSFSSSPLLQVLNVPIFLATTGLLDGNGNLTNLVILPIRGATFGNVAISPDNNCIGTLDVQAFTSAACKDDPSTCSKWNTAGVVAGYITLQDADAVNISLLNESLCVLLTGTTKDPMTNKCQPSAFSMGDYCSTTMAPGGCRDSSWLAATFAASAVVINAGSADPICH